MLIILQGVRNVLPCLRRNAKLLTKPGVKTMLPSQRTYVMLTISQGVGNELLSQRSYVMLLLRAKTLARLMVSLHDLSQCNPMTFFRLLTPDFLLAACSLHHVQYLCKIFPPTPHHSLQPCNDKVIFALGCSECVTELTERRPFRETACTPNQVSMREGEATGKQLCS